MTLHIVILVPLSVLTCYPCTR